MAKDLSVAKLQAKLMRDYYKDFSKYSKGKKTDHKVAWVTAFTPVEILEALGISYYYPESYAAVIAASNKEQEAIEHSEKQNLSRNCCSYSCCFNGCLELDSGPRGNPPTPDVLIATNNQCNTLPGWWNVLAVKYNIPLIVLDYPGENADRETALVYVTDQHRALISTMEKLSGNKMNETMLEELILNSKNSVNAWKSFIDYIPVKEIDPTMFFDGINFLITARCKQDVAQLYEILAKETESEKDADGTFIPLFWLGYPLWYHSNRYLNDSLDGFRIVGSDYVTWWNLDYKGSDVYEQLFNAYNYTFLNLTQESRDKRIKELLQVSGAKCAIVLHNKSCKCDFVSAKNISIPQAEIEIDMIDRTYLDTEKAERLIRLMRDTVCSE